MKFQNIMSFFVRFLKKKFNLNKNPQPLLVRVFLSLLLTFRLETSNQLIRVLDINTSLASLPCSQRVLLQDISRAVRG
jgi:hypothetical protein